MTHSLTIKRVAAPATWALQKKNVTFVMQPMPGAHSFRLGTSLAFLLRDILHIARTSREAQYILNNKDFLVNGVGRKDKKFLAGFMDTLSFVATNQHYRIVLGNNGALSALAIDASEAKKKLVKIIGKTITPKARIQLNLSDSRNILVDKNEYAISDSLLIEVPEQKILDYFKLEKNVPIILTDGKHCGKIGIVEELVKDTIVFRVDKDIYRTRKAFAFVLGKEALAIKVR